MSNLRSDSRALVADRPPGDVVRAHVERLCFQVDDVEERWHAAERALKATHEECERLRRAIREHRDQRGDDRCWVDDERLYRAIGEPVPPDATALPPKEDFLESCGRYYEQRRCPLDVYPPGKMRIAELEAEVARLGLHVPPTAYTCPRCGSITGEPYNVAVGYCPACDRHHGTDEV